VVNNGRVTLDNTINRQIAAITSVGDLLVFEDFDCGFNGVNCCSTSFEDSHGHSGSTEKLSVRSNGDFYLNLEKKQKTLQRRST
jgi:hypothetical protein